MTDGDDIDALAAEYVLGTLDAPERAAVAARRQRQPALNAAILRWEQRLSPLNDLVPPVEPSASRGMTSSFRRMRPSIPATAADLW